MFRRILIANRGEVAARIARTCRRLGVQTVLVVSEADQGQPWQREVDIVVPIGPSKSAMSYLDESAILAVGRHHQCSAIHPGWGFLSENARFAQRCEDAGLSFIGPSPEHIRTMGDKVMARRTMAALGMPMIPGSKRPLADVEDARVLGKEVGYPLLLKAVSGGGGRGMRRVDSRHQLQAAFEEASSEASSAFGDGRLYLERCIVNGRHVEVQIIADRFGNCVHLGERECSLQRRHQKVLEEAPSPGLSESERARILPLVAQVVKRSGYVNAGTVEMLLDASGQLFFMEMNTRLQVEHCVTEEIVGLDLVELQLRVAANEALPITQEQVRFNGHAIECRINAEDPSDGFRPCPGVVSRLRLPSGLGVRVETSLQEGDRISPYYDSMIAKIVTHAPSRPEAISAMIRALNALEIEGVKTNRDLHLRILSWPVFVSGTYDTTSLERDLMVN